MLSECGQWLSIRRTREKCAKCVFGRVKPCKCCDSTGLHLFPGTQLNPGGSSRPLGRVIEGEIRAHKDKRSAA